jgi:hypothetical protein
VDLVTRVNTHRGKQAAAASRIYSRKAIEQAFLETFEMIGGVPRLATWAHSSDENYGEFLKLLTKFAPKESLQQSMGNVIEYRSNIPQSPLNGAVPDVAEGEFIPADQPDA